MSKHTPGPWEAMWTNDVGPDDEYYVEFYEILDAKGNRVGTAEEKHDAVLMAEAPKLLEALKWALSNINCEPYEWSDEENADAHEAARAAIAKATGADQQS